MEAVIVLLKIVFILSFQFGLLPLFIWLERKGSAYIQDRRGPNRAAILGFTIGGIFHTIADGIKMFVKEDIMPQQANKALFALAPVLVVIPSLLTFAIVPFGDVLTIGERVINLQVASLNVGILYIFAISSLGVYGIVLAGWASNNKYSLLGGLRSSAQMISYEITLGLAIIGILMIYQALDLQQIVRQQNQLLFGFIPLWGVVLQPLGFILFIVAGFAEVNRTPFDLPEGESEIVAGYHTEYSSLKFAMFYMGEYINMVVMSAVITTLFFGGWQIPFLYRDGFHIFSLSLPLHPILVTLLQVGAFAVKVMFFCWFFVWTRWTLPRVRYDQLMKLGWKLLLPLALANIFITGIIIILVK
ncbi:NADH-quinone oxidoreductase subunit NuoH [candidate division CSSED10-310 bacterium]|uniref:NADH-quinone oxidoreductase subunit H n=1 Tax=candidate division CSSED10-310 bacterium TaxID=2855610 RepID=A0ABV6Z2G9_UNCC1